MLDEKVEKERCIGRVKAAYALGLYGNHSAALDGSAVAMFTDTPDLTSGDRFAGGKKKAGKRRRDEEGDGRPKKNKKQHASIEKYLSQQ